MNTNKNIPSTPLCVRKTYLAGAGISMDAPSYFPSATQIINMAYESLCSNNPMEQDDFPWQTYKRKLQEHNLRFELVMEIILSADSQINILEAIQKYTEPNENHYYLAKLAIQGNYIFTTNFDDLIERAICNLGYSPITICSQSDYISYQEHKQSAIPIFKLHGSYYRYTGYHKKVVSKRTIQAALSTITSGNSRMILPSYKEHLLVRCISQSSELVFIGYSGSDDFDIMPTLQNLNIPSIVWIDHNNCICYKNVIHKYHISDNERSHFLASIRIIAFCSRPTPNIFWRKRWVKTYQFLCHKRGTTIILSIILRNGALGCPMTLENFFWESCCYLVVYTKKPNMYILKFLLISPIIA